MNKVQTVEEIQSILQGRGLDIDYSEDYEGIPIDIHAENPDGTSNFFIYVNEDTTNFGHVSNLWNIKKHNTNIEKKGCNYIIIDDKEPTPTAKLAANEKGILLLKDANQLNARLEELLE